MVAIILLLLAGCETETPHVVARDGCIDPEPILNVEGEPSGYERCADGSRIRMESVPVDLAWYSENMEPCEQAHYEECSQHSDCGDTRMDRCVCESHYYWGDSNVCVQVCESDDDCGENSVCVAPEQGGSNLGVPTCRGVRCRTSSDCASGECGATWFGGESGTVFTTACRDDFDLCRVDSGCGEPNTYCWPQVLDGWGDGGTVWACKLFYFEYD
jgi:hypothetical protein